MPEIIVRYFILNTSINFIILPTSSCLAKELHLHLNNSLLIDAPEISRIDLKNKTIIDFSSPFKIQGNYKLYKEALFIYYASSVSIQKKYVNIGNISQKKYNQARIRNKEFFNTVNAGIKKANEIVIPMVACRKDSLLWKFYRGEIEEKELFNKKLVIPWLPTNQFISQLVIKLEAKKNKKIKFKNKKDSIETLFHSLRNSAEFLLD